MINMLVWILRLADQSNPWEFKATGSEAAHKHHG